MLTPMQWLWQRLEQILDPAAYTVLRDDFETHQLDYGRHTRRQEQQRRLAGLRRQLDTPSSAAHIKRIREMIERLEKHLSKTEEHAP